MREAWRTLRRGPLYTTVSLINLSAAIGLAAAVFLYADPILWRDLPVAHADDLLAVTNSTFSYPLYLDLRDRIPVFASLGARYATPVDFRVENRTRRIHAEVVSGNWFDTLGLGVALGRPLSPEDDRVPGGHSVAVLTYDFWQSQFHGARDVLRRVILLNGHPMTVVGVAARGYRGFDLGERTDVLAPVMMQAAMVPTWDGLQDRGRPWLELVGRLRPDVTVEQAEARLDPFYRALSGLEPSSPGVVSEGPALRLARARQGVSELRPRLAAGVGRACRWAAVLIVLMWANQTALVLYRTGLRQRDAAIRMALGATRRVVLREFAAEGLILAVAATGIGLLLTAWIAGGAYDLVADASQTGVSGRITLPVAAFAFVLALVSNAIPAVTAALRSRALPLTALLGQRPQNAMRGPGRALWMKIAAAAAIAAALVLVWRTGTGYALLGRLRAKDLGVPSARLASFSVDPSLAGYSSERVRRFAEALRARLDSTAGIVSAAATDTPILGDGDGRAVRIPGHPPAAPQVRAVGPGYFATLGVALLRGREGEVVNLAYGPAPGATGVAPNVRTRLEGPPEPTLYVPLYEQPMRRPVIFYFRTKGDPRSVFAAVYREVAQLDANLPVNDVRTMGDEIADVLAPERVQAAASASMAGVALAGAGVGMFVLAAGLAARRRHEFRIRLALGASRHALRAAIVREVGVVAAIGAAAGAALLLVV